MNWKEKMDTVVKDVLGIEYTCEVKSEHSFTIYENNEVIITRATSYSLEAHWRSDLLEVVSGIFIDRIKSALSKV